MKRKDLEVGKSYYWARPSDWREDYEGKEVRVVDLAVYRRGYSGSGKYVERPTETATGGSVVHVERQAPWRDSVWMEDFVRPQDLRGNYATEHAAWQERRAARDSAEAALRTKAMRDRAERHAVTEHAKKLGFGTVEPAHHSDTRVSITTGQLAELLAIAARAGGR